MTAASGPLPIQVTPSGLSPTVISCSALRLRGIDDGDGAVVGVGDQQPVAVGRDVHQAVGSAGVDGGAEQKDGEERQQRGIGMVPRQVGKGK